jgi:hypothetical protein
MVQRDIDRRRKRRFRYPLVPPGAFRSPLRKNIPTARRCAEVLQPAAAAAAALLLLPRIRACCQQVRESFDHRKCGRRCPCSLRCFIACAVQIVCSRRRPGARDARAATRTRHNEKAAGKTHARMGGHATIMLPADTRVKVLKVLSCLTPCYVSPAPSDSAPEFLSLTMLLSQKVLATMVEAVQVFRARHCFCG